MNDFTIANRTTTSHIRGGRLLLIRHGESTYNAEDRFTGWADAPLSTKGEGEMVDVAGQLRPFQITHVLTSDLKRSIQSGMLIARTLTKVQQVSPAMHAHFELRGRNDGALVGKNKTETALLYGDVMAPRWRKDYFLALPGGESLHDVVTRVKPFVASFLLPLIQRQANVACVVHGNTIRALLVALAVVTPEETGELWLRNGTLIEVELEFDSQGSARGGAWAEIPPAGIEDALRAHQPQSGVIPYGRAGSLPKLQTGVLSGHTV